MEFSFHTTLNSTQQQHVQKHYSCISRPQKFYVKIRSHKLDLYTSIYGICFNMEEDSKLDFSRQRFTKRDSWNDQKCGILLNTWATKERYDSRSSQRKGNIVHPHTLAHITKLVENQNGKWQWRNKCIKNQPTVQLEITIKQFTATEMENKHLTVADSFPSSITNSAQWRNKPKNLGGPNTWIQANNTILFGKSPRKAQNDYIF